jgi:uncharacterized protein YjbI with pentapeptide repeats
MDFKAGHFFLTVTVNAALACGLSAKACAFNSTDVKTLQTGVASWNIMRATHKESIPDLSGADLKGKNLRKIDFHDTNLAGAILSQSDLSNANLQNASLENAHLRGTLLIHANLDRSLLRRADLENAVLDGANFHQSNLEGAILKRADCTNADMSGSNLKDCNFREGTLVNTDLSGADLRGSYLWRANLSRAKITGARVSEKTILETGKMASKSWAEQHGALFVVEHQASATINSLNVIHIKDKKSEMEQPPVNTTHSEAELINDTTLSDRDAVTTQTGGATGNIWRQGETVNATYSNDQFQQLKSNVFAWNDMRKQNKKMNVELTGAPLDHKNLSYADLNHAKLSTASFRATDLSKSNLRFADLRGCNLQEANFENADLYGADLRGANLWRANLDRAQLNGGKVSNKTILTSGKKATVELSVRAGLIFISE